MRRTRRTSALNVRVTPEIHKAVKQLSRVEEIPMERIVEQALVTFLKEHRQHATASTHSTV